MSRCRFRFASQEFVALPSGAMHWPAQDALIVADLHLGKSERMARRGGALLPPYETRATLARLASDLAASGARRLIALGDSFDDDLACAQLGPDLGALQELCAQHHVIWIAGNHDPAPAGLPGEAQPEITLSGIALRHIASAGPDLSGHYHPKLRVAGQRRAAFLVGAAHVILPAYGAYTGGLDAQAPVLRALVPQGIAILTGQAARVVPLNQPQSQRMAPLGGAR